MLLWFTGLPFAIYQPVIDPTVDQPVISQVLSVEPRLAQANEEPPQPVEIITEQIVRPLPGGLNDVPVFNSNSPELVGEPGIFALYLFRPRARQRLAPILTCLLRAALMSLPIMFYKALDYDAETPELLDSLYVGVLIHNPSSEPVTVRVLSGASLLEPARCALYSAGIIYSF